MRFLEPKVAQHSLVAANSQACAQLQQFQATPWDWEQLLQMGCCFQFQLCQVEKVEWKLLVA